MAQNLSQNEKLVNTTPTAAKTGLVLTRASFASTRQLAKGNKF